MIAAPQHLRNDLSTLPNSVRASLERTAAQFIGGEWVVSKETIPVVDPSSGHQIASIAKGGSAEVEAAVAAARQSLRSNAWRGLGPMGRERLLMRLADLIEENAELIAYLETLDNGMPLWMAADMVVPGSVSVYRYFAGWPSKLTGDTMDVSGPPGAGRYFGFTRREPVGVVAAIVPWNMPFMLAAWKLAPALAAGCTVVLKPAEDASLTALVLADLVEEAGFPGGVLNVVTGYGHEAGESLVRRPDVAKISFTGSTATGRHIAEVAGANLTRLTLELGGKSPTIIFDDADLSEAVSGAAHSIFLNSGQTCVAGSRLYVHQAVFDRVLDGLRTYMNTLKVGPGLSLDTKLGPLINARQQARVQGYIDQARARGMDVISGPVISKGSGFFVDPTIITGASHPDPITQEEIFGPVLSVYRFSDEAEAIALANGTSYGLAATIWSRDVDRVLKMTEELECGKVIVNDQGFPYPGLPEGGQKASGYGRDLGREAVEQCLETKTVLVKLSS